MLTIGAGLGGIKTAVETVKGINATITDVKIAEAKAEIIGNLITAQQAMLDAQATLLEDTDTIRALEAEIVKLKDWSAEAERYELADTGQGALAYRPKPGMQGGEPDHWLCPNCFANGKKAFLQPEQVYVGRAEILKCFVCAFDVVTRGVRMDPAPAGRRP